MHSLLHQSFKRKKTTEDFNWQFQIKNRYDQHKYQKTFLFNEKDFSIFFFFVLDTESSYGNPNESSPISLKWRLRTQSENAFQNYTGGSGDSISNVDSKKDDFTEPSFIQEVEKEDSGSSNAISFQTEFVSHAKVRRDILKHVNRMCNPVWAKGSKQSLLQ